MRRAVVIGAGLAGASVAHALAMRDWQVTVLEAAAAPAQGASGLPAGLMSARSGRRPDASASPLSLAAAAVTRRELAYLREGVDWAPSGAVVMPGAQVDETVCWVRPVSLVHHWLSHPRIELRLNTPVPSLAALATLCPDAEAVIVCAGPHSKALLPLLQTHTVRGQVSLGRVPLDVPWLTRPVRGHGTFIPSAQIDGQAHWLSAASYEHERLDLLESKAEHQQNRDRVRYLVGAIHPALAQWVDAQFQSGQVQAWVGLRCTSSTRQPVVQRMTDPHHSRVYVLTALGSRGITMAALLGQQLAQQVDHDA
jgi:tRNA 5-methylaminomethyl-2-thiouridine biosynthesis bifunctional protein